MQKVILLFLYLNSLKYVMSSAMYSDLINFDSLTITLEEIVEKSNDHSWSQYIFENELTFDTLTWEMKCWKTFRKNLNEIDNHNSNFGQIWSMGKNKYTHLPIDEFQKGFCRTQIPLSKISQFSSSSLSSSSEETSFSSSSSSNQENINNLLGATFEDNVVGVAPFGNYTDPPASLNYTHLMQPIQDQAACGCCWAFSALNQIEAVKKAQNSSFNTIYSPSYLVDCDFLNFGCFGGWPANALFWLKLSGRNRAPSITIYPYTIPTLPNIKNNCTRFPAALYNPLGIVTISDSGYVTEDSLKLLVANYGPIIVAIYASRNFQLYQSGIFIDNDCFTGDCFTVNHAVLIVGYGTDNATGIDYWILRNSWGTSWGEGGYMKFARNNNNMCQISCWPQYAIF